MKLKFSGTGASEGIPAPFCRCPVCENARKTLGKEVRLRTGVLVDDAVLIDFSPDSMVQALYNQVDYSGLQALLITHTHSDHFALDDLIQRSECNARNRTRPVLSICGSRQAIQRVKDALHDESAAQSVSLHSLQSGETAQVGDYRVTALKTTHMESEDSFIYIITYDGKSYLHAVDSAELTEDTLTYLKQSKTRFDAVSLDCTFGLLKEEYYGHMNLRQNARVRQKLMDIGAADANTRFFLTHISHYAENTHRQLEHEAEPLGFAVAFDGLQVDL